MSEEELRKKIKELNIEMKELESGFLDDCNEVQKVIVGKSNRYSHKLHNATVQRWALLDEIRTPLRAELKGIREGKKIADEKWQEMRNKEREKLITTIQMKDSLIFDLKQTNKKRKELLKQIDEK